MSTVDSFQSTSVLCSISYVLSRNFENLIDCYTSRLGLTEECATLWAHYSATNAGLCSNECSSGFSGDVELNGPAPECELGECLACSNATFQGDFNSLSGRTEANSGITQEIARPCSDFFPVVHDPCEGGNGTASPTEPSTPTTPPTPPSGSVQLHGIVGCAAAAILTALAWAGWM